MREKINSAYTLPHLNFKCSYLLNFLIKNKYSKSTFAGNLSLVMKNKSKWSVPFKKRLTQIKNLRMRIFTLSYSFSFVKLPDIKHFSNYKKKQLRNWMHYVIWITLYMHVEDTLLTYPIILNDLSIFVCMYVHLFTKTTLIFRVQWKSGISGFWGLKIY